MKKLTLSVCLILLSPLAMGQNPTKKLKSIINSSAFSHGCGLETTSPKIKKGEVKITYSCDDFKVPDEGVVKEEITFYEAKNGTDELDKMGLIIRSRVDLNDSTKKDVTIKFRPKDQSEEIELEKVLYDALDERSDVAKEKAKLDGTEQAEKLKCEADVSYRADANKLVNSCSWTTTTSDLNSGHQSFAQMATSSSVATSLSEYDSIKISAQSWKIKTESFPKGISAERWDVKNADGKELCILELSIKFEVEKDPKETLPERLAVEADAAMSKLLSSHSEKMPSLEQGNKAGKAISFVKAP
jgi:flagellar hook protein FlgE